MSGYDLPALNAALNGSCAALLLAGYAAIRARKVRLHAGLMLTALAASGAFLGSYLYYHLAVRGGEATRYPGDGLDRMVYLGILLTHTVLAAAVAPMALVTAFLGLTGRLARHVRLARWTLPVWLYVSATGVIIYLMLRDQYPTGP